jgi:hypothetical protein
MAQPITYVFDPKIGLPLDRRSVVTDTSSIDYPYVGQMFYDVSRGGFYYIDTLVNGGASFTTKSIFLSDTNALGNLQVDTLTAKEVFLLSDGRLKSNCEPITGALEMLAQLKPTRYETHHEDAGFIAQELATTDFKFLVRDSDMHVRYNPLVAYLVSAVNDLSARVRLLEAEKKEGNQS